MFFETFGTYSLVYNFLAYKEIGEKAAHKMLVKMTPDKDHSSYLSSIVGVISLSILQYCTCSMNHKYLESDFRLAINFVCY